MADPSLVEQIGLLREAARRPEVVAVMHDFYAESDRLIAAKGATCWNRGACCHFGMFGHRLYVTALEVCYYLATAEPPPPVNDDTCPHAREGRCHARERRPLGCRVFYCDPAAQGWQGPVSEERLGRLRAMHDELNVPYFYADWIAVLRALIDDERGAADGST
jgi:hypothetical protein